jgi:hypothetical protein
MGIDSNHARFLLSARRRGVLFRRSGVLGRQFCMLDSATLSALLHDFGLVPTPDVMQACNAYGEPFLRFLGAEEIVSIDASSYQEPTLLHDMNQPIPGSLESRFDVVIDGGTLEHIFNFPIAIRNCMEMVSVGGHLLIIAPANNLCGHGFFQFSPDLFFRIFTKENGFQVERAVLCETRADSEWFELVDPLKCRQFVEFVNQRPTYLLVQAKKLEEVPLFPSWPQQSVYTFLWNKEYPGSDASKAMVLTSRI